MSEYGFQSFPEYSTFKRFAIDEDEDIYSSVMKHHQRSSIGNVTIEQYMDREFKKPKNFEAMLYTSQLLQADGIKIGIEAHRRNKEKCMGSLYWQLNDCWPGASWSSIDYFGKWKALHYKVKKAFAPIIISHEFIDSNLHISVISDQLVSFQGSIEVKILTFSSDSLIGKWSEKVFLKPLEVIKKLKISKEYLPLGKNKQNTYVSLSLKSKEKIISAKNVFFLPFKKLKIPFPKLNYECSIIQKEKQILVNVTSKNFAKGVHVSSSSNENFSDNFFDLSPNGNKTILIPYHNSQDPEEIIKTIEIKSLWDSYN
jgi:beta-mannosidase